jgi:hypothetical protein
MIDTSPKRDEVPNDPEGMLADFELLTHPGNLGFYSRCEITTAFLHDKASKRNVNCFALVVFEESAVPAQYDKQVLEKLLPVSASSTWSLGVFRHYETISESRKRFSDLLGRCRWSDGTDNLEAGPFRPVRRQFVPPQESAAAPLGSVLKNNFDNGSYVLEFFDEEKRLLDSVLSVEEARRVRRLLREHLPLDLDAVPERLGNILFQFPVRLVATNEKLNHKQGRLDVRFSWHPELHERPSVRLIAKSTFDGVTTDIGTADTLSSTESIGSGAMHSHMSIEVLNPTTQLIYSEFEGYFARSVACQMHLTDGSRVRTFRAEDGEHKVDLGTTSRFGVGGSMLMSEERIRKRMLATEKATLALRGQFRQFCSHGQVERREALIHVRKLISDHGTNGLCLWDPFLTYGGILNTLYYCSEAKAPLRAIGVFNGRTKDVLLGGTYEKFVASQRLGLESSGNNVGLKLEFRCVHDGIGWDFHDRFLIAMAGDKYSTPRAWSLGTSVNSLGKRHHIVQEVPDAAIVLEAFEALWDALGSPDCVVWSWPKA